jgi:hypothetical protein
MLYMIYPSSAGDQSLWCSWFDGTDWHGDTGPIVTAGGSTPLAMGTPTLTVFQDRLEMVYQASWGGSSGMWLSWFDGTSWHGDHQISTD